MKVKCFSVVFFLLCIQDICGAQKREDGLDASPQTKSYSAFSFMKEAMCIFTPDENPTWNRAFTKASIGITGLFISNNIKMENQAEYYAFTAMGWASAGLTLNALSDIMYLAYDHLRHSSIARQAFARTMKRTPLAEEKYDQLIAQSNHELTRVTRAGRFVLNSASTAYFINAYFQKLMGMFENNTNPFGLSYPEGMKCSNGDFLCSPIMIPIFLTLFTVTLGYNLWELSHFNQPSFPDRGEVPFFGFVNGFVRIGLSALIPKSYNVDLKTLQALAQPSLYSISITSQAHKHLTPGELYYVYVEQHNFHFLDRIVYKVAQESGNLMVYSSLVLVLKNMGSYIWQAASIKKIVKNDAAALSASGPQERRRLTPSLPSAAQIDALKASSHSSNLEEKASSGPSKEKSSLLLSNSSIEKEDTIGVRKREKTHGVSDISRAQRQPRSSALAAPQSLSAPDDPTLPIREEALTQLRALRRLYPIKTQVIESELRKVERFLNGKIVPVTGSIFSLVWHIGENQFAMNFEIPHAADKGVYRGNKLDRVLSVLETSYLVGLSEDKINEYITAHDLYHLLRLDKFMFYIFFNRNR